MSKTLLPSRIHPSWAGFLTDCRLKQLDQISKQIGPDYNPAPDKVLYFLTTNLTTRRIVILGQDPYPQAGIASGRAFEVKGLTSWLDTFPQSSLRNIVRLLYATDHDLTDYADIPKFTEIRSEIGKKAWQIAPPHKLFVSWEQQGVMLLNTTFTVKDRPGEHKASWADFTQDLLRFISSQQINLHWFLWGKQAQALRPFIKNGIIHSCRHPMLASPSYQDCFLRSNCFRVTKELINWLGT